MIERYLIPAGAGLVSAVTFISVALGDPGMGVLLYVIIPLPIFLAGLALGWPAALVAGATASLVILAAGGSALSAAAFMATQAAPPIVLSYLALLNRPSADPSALEWYPSGRLIVAAAALGALFSLAFMIGLGGTPEAIKEKAAPFIQQIIEARMKDMPDPAPIAAADIPKIAEAATALLPAMAALTAMGLSLFNLWLAGRITRASGKLSRPWPDLAALQLPRGTPIAFAIATAGSFLPGLPGLFAAAASGTLFFAYLLLGLAVAHFTSRGNSWRPFALWALYFALLFFNPALLLVATVGLIDSIWPLRRGLSSHPS